MSVYLFIGPSLTRAEARALLPGVHCLPPVRQGDVYRVALHRPAAIGLIDGYFQGIPAVRHKEILWAMAQGIHVFGAASMGALRAAELAQFGMVGIGRVFEDYQTGTLEDDDEVAVLHGPAAAGYAAATEALVNIRCTLAQAEQAGVIAAATHQALLAIGKELFHYRRTYANLLAQGAERGLPAAELAALASWLTGNRIDQKCLDALALVTALRDFLAESPDPKDVLYRFESTTIWEQARLPALAVTGDDGHLQWLLLDDFLAELLLSGDPSWDGGREQRLQTLIALDDPQLDRHLEDYLRAVCDYPRFLARALAKRDALTAAGLLQPDPDALDIGRAELLDWYFQTRLNAPVPADPADPAHQAGFPDTAAFIRAVAGEYLYQHPPTAS